MNNLKIYESYSENTKNFKEEIMNGYLECVLWTEELDDYNIRDVDKNSIEDSKKDINIFISVLRSKNLLNELVNNMTADYIGHNFWLNRNGHGTGFWDRGLDDIGEEISDICRKFNQKYAYVGDDKKIYID